MKVTRYKSTFSTDFISLEDYLKKMKEGQEKIYFLVAPTKQLMDANPFLETFKDNDIPVLVLQNHIDEVCFKQIEKYKGHQFVSIESSIDELGKDIKKKVKVDKERGLPEEDTTTFSLWLKAELEPSVAKVSIS